MAASPEVRVNEIDLSRVITVPTTVAAGIGGYFRWGPVSRRTLIRNETELAERFGTPNGLSDQTFYTAASFLAYSDLLYVVRADANSMSGFLKTTVSPNDVTNSSIISGGSGYANGDVVQVVGGSGSNKTTLNLTTNTSGGVVGFTVNNNGSYVAWDYPTSIVRNTPSNIVDFKPVTGSGTNLKIRMNFAPITSNQEAISINNYDEWESVIGYNGYSADTSLLWLAKYPGTMGNALKISVCDSPAAFRQSMYTAMRNASANATFVVGSPIAQFRAANSAAADTLESTFILGDVFQITGTRLGTQTLKVIGKDLTGANVDVLFDNPFSLAANVLITTNSTSFVMTDTVNVGRTNLIRNWEYAQEFTKAPGTSSVVAQRKGINDELHIVVVDNTGEISGTRGQILEKFQGLSRATDLGRYYVTQIARNSKYIWWANHRTGAPATTAAASWTASTTLPFTALITTGSDQYQESNLPLSALFGAYDLFKSPEEIDVSILMTGLPRGGLHGEALTNYIIDNICEYRKDCIVTCSPALLDINTNVDDDITSKIIELRNAITPSSYAVMDSGHKIMYDRYQNKNITVPLNGDVAGLIVRSERERDSWWSPAGYNRGKIKNVTKLVYNPPKPDRDLLYQADVNPIVTFPGDGTLLFGDKTMLGQDSAFSRINVRRLFITLQKAISNAAKYSLFEFNDEFTRAQFVGLVEPFLRDIQGRRGIIDYRVICDETNNTPEVIDRNEFIGDIYVKPVRSINFIQLNFVALRSDVEFSEVIGQFN